VPWGQPIFSRAVLMVQLSCALVKRTAISASAALLTIFLRMLAITNTAPLWSSRGLSGSLRFFYWGRSILLLLTGIFWLRDRSYHCLLLEAWGCDGTVVRHWSWMTLELDTCDPLTSFRPQDSLILYHPGFSLSLSKWLYALRLYTS